jgi:hypothetical protein
MFNEEVRSQKSEVRSQIFGSMVVLRGNIYPGISCNV